jgi:hypothetical protein
MRLTPISLQCELSRKCFFSDGVFFTSCEHLVKLIREWLLFDPVSCIIDFFMFLFCEFLTPFFLLEYPFWFSFLLLVGVCRLVKGVTAEALQLVPFLRSAATFLAFTATLFHRNSYNL